VVSEGRRRRDSYGYAYTESQQGDVLVAVVDVVHYRHGCFARPAYP
jgi:hypothetical protein